MTLDFTPHRETQESFLLGQNAQRNLVLSDQSLLIGKVVQATS